MAMYIVTALNITTMAMQLITVVIVVNHDYTVGYNCHHGLHHDHLLMVTAY